MARSDNNQLLDEILAEEQAAFRDAMLHETLRLARRRRVSRQLRPILPVLAMLAICAWVWWPSTPPAGSVVTPVTRSYPVVSTSPLPADQVVSTSPLPQEMLVTSTSRFARVETRVSEYPFQEVDDGELLSLAGTRPAVLVRYGTRSATLIFVEQEETASLNN